MEETFYEMLERTRAVDRLLFWFAVVLPPAIAATAAMLRQSPIVDRHRHRWVLALLAAPGLLVLWKVYNAVTDHFGLETLMALFANIGVFAAAALGVTGLRLLLKAALYGPPSAHPRNTPAVAIPQTEFRPYKAGGLPAGEGSSGAVLKSSPEKPAESAGEPDDIG